MKNYKKYSTMNTNAHIINFFQKLNFNINILYIIKVYFQYYEKPSNRKITNSI